MIDLSSNEEFEKYEGNEGLPIHPNLNFNLVVLDLGLGKDNKELLLKSTKPRGNEYYKSPDNPVNMTSDLWSWAAMVLSLYAGSDNKIMKSLTKEELQELITKTFNNLTNPIDIFF